MKTVLNTLVWLSLAGVVAVIIWLAFPRSMSDPPGYRESVQRRSTGPSLQQFLLLHGDDVDLSTEILPSEY